MIIDKKKVNGGYTIFIRCPFCGEPITNTNIEFGMDCKNKCSEKEFKKMIDNDPMFAKMINNLKGGEDNV